MDNDLRTVKFLSRQWSRDDAFTARFRREVWALRQVRHKNVVDCGDLERAEDDSLFFSMEFVDGPDLRDFLYQAQRPLDVGLALSITRDVATGLDAAHVRKMVHRDIKPDNILMTWDGDAWVPKIADFGIVATKESSSIHTRTGSSLLTMAYAAPEQWLGMRAAELDGRTDLYALGGVFYEMLTGRTVFDAESYEGWAREHLNAVPRPPSELRPELLHWRGLDALVIRLLAKDRADRPKDVAEVLTLLDAIRYVAPAQRQQTVVEKTGARNAATVEPSKEQPRRAMDPQTNVPVRWTSKPHTDRARDLSEAFAGWQWGAGALLLVAVLAAGLTLYLRVQVNRSNALSVGSTNTGRLVGTVRNKSGKPISGVTVTLLNSWERNVNGESKKRLTSTGNDGTYEFDSLPLSGGYWLAFDARGFIGSEGNSGDVVNDHATRCDVILQPGRSQGLRSQFAATTGCPPEGKHAARRSVLNLGFPGRPEQRL